MRTLVLISIFFLIISSYSYPSKSDWEKVVYTDVGTLYIDFDRIRKVDGFIYYWVLMNFEKEKRSFLIYTQSDCKVFKLKRISWTTYKGTMGKGESYEKDTSKRKWEFPLPNSILEKELKSICK